MPVRRLDGRGWRTLDSADIRRVPNLALADDSLPYVLILDGGPLRTPPRVVMTCRRLESTGFWIVILSAPQYEKVILLFRSEASESPASSSSSSLGSDASRGCLPQGECQRHGVNRKRSNTLIRRNNTFTWFNIVGNVTRLNL